MVEGEIEKMSGSAENMAHGAWEKSSRPEIVVNLATANRMLSLLRPVIDDMLTSRPMVWLMSPRFAATISVPGIGVPAIPPE